MVGKSLKHASPDVVSSYDMTCVRLEGEGTMAYRDGHVYEGQFKNWMKDGKGKMTYRNGDLHLGEWKGDDGKGTITHNDGSSYQV